MTTIPTNYLRLNNLFPSDMDIIAVKKYKRTGVFPASADTERKRNAFKAKYQFFELSKNGQNLMYTPTNLQVVSKISRKMILTKEYKNSFGSGSRNFYRTIREKYLNIKRSDVQEFMKAQTVNQLTDGFKHRTNKPIVAKYPNEIWCIDLIEINNYPKNKGFDFILSCIDVFSRYTFLEPSKKRDSNAISKCLDKIIKRVKIKPRFLICDNGGEFEKDFETYCKAHDITIQRNRAYSPQANGIVESSNKEVRKLLRSIMLENKSTNWVDNLRKVEDYKNNTFTTSIDNLPNKIWTPTNEPIDFKLDGDDTQLKQTYAKRTILKNVRKQIDQFKEDELNVGDKVRIRMDQVSNNIRALVKAGDTKKIVVTWSPVIFKILKKITPKKTTLERSRYVVGTVDSTLMLVNKQNGTKPRNFYSNSLKKVDDEETNYKDLSMQEAIQLSGVELNQNDVYSAPYKP